MKEEIYQFLITLNGSDPLIWRRFQVNNDISFDRFHRIIQVVMGWKNNHLYEFRFKKYSILTPDTETYPWDKSIRMYGDEIRLCEMLKRTGQKFRYLYDLGDNWEHDILFEKRLPVDRNRKYPACIEGEMACPPEDIGGIWLYYERLEISRGEKEDNDKKWAGHLKQFLGDFDPTYFNPDETNDELKRTSGKDLDIDIDVDEDFLFEEMIDQYLETVDTPFRLTDCFDKLELKKTKEIETEIHELIATSGEVVEDNDCFYPKVSFLRDFAIRITPTEFEIEKGILIPGHRLLPFLPFDILPDEAMFVYNDTVLEGKEVLLTVDQLYAYFALLDSDELPIIDAGPPVEGNYRASFIAFDLARFYKANQFEPGDSIILKMEDFINGFFSIHYDPVSSFKIHEEEIRTWDKLFLNTLKKVLRQNIEKSSLEKQLMYTYYYMSCSLSPGQKNIPGTEVGVLLRRTKEISYSELEDTGKIFHFGDQMVVNLSHKDS